MVIVVDEDGLAVVLVVNYETLGLLFIEEFESGFELAGEAVGIDAVGVDDFGLVGSRFKGFVYGVGFEGRDSLQAPADIG